MTASDLTRQREADVPHPIVNIRFSALQLNHIRTLFPRRYYSNRTQFVEAAPARDSGDENNHYFSVCFIILRAFPNEYHKIYVYCFDVVGAWSKIIVKKTGVFLFRLKYYY